MRRAISSATALLPEAVGPKMAMTCCEVVPVSASRTQAAASTLELVVPQARRTKVPLDASVAPLELVEHLNDRLGRRPGDPANELALLLRLGLGEPPVVARPQPLLA